MKIHIENQVLEYENNKDEIENILKEIDKIISNSSKILSHMVIDDIEVYESYGDYLLDHIKAIDKVEAILLTYKELVDDILLSKINYLERTPQQIEGLASGFYREPDEESWQGLNDLLEGVGWIIETFSSIDQDPRLKEAVKGYESWNLYAKEVFTLQKILGEFEEVLENNDLVSIGDILSYEIIPIFKNMSQQLDKLVTREDISNDLN